MEKIAHYSCLFVCEKIHKQIFIKIFIFNPFAML